METAEDLELQAEFDQLRSTHDSLSKTTTPEPQASKLSDEPKARPAKCEKHGSFLQTRFWMLTDWSRWTNCPRCVEDEARRAKEEAEAANQRRAQYLLEQRLKTAAIPARFAEKYLSGFIPADDMQTKIKQICVDYAENFEERLAKGTCLTFVGTTGVGKTHLACGIANHIIHNKNKSALFTSAVKAVRAVKETYGKKDERESEVIKSFGSPDLLILDEIGVQFGSDTEKMILFEILNERYENFKPTIVISNLSPENLSEFVGDRIMDRMKENGGKLIKFTWKSHRDKLATIEETSN